jgi:hypothetical protein
MNAGTSPEFSRRLPLDTIFGENLQRRIVANEAECAALAERLDLQRLSEFSATLTVGRDPAGEIMVRGRVVADVVQTCVVSLEPCPGHIDEPFEARFTARAAPLPRELEIGPDDDEPPEPIDGDTLDIGELAAQQLALARDFSGGRSPDGPFAALAALRPACEDEQE